MTSNRKYGKPLRNLIGEWIEKGRMPAEFEDVERVSDFDPKRLEIRRDGNVADVDFEARTKYTVEAYYGGDHIGLVEVTAANQLGELEMGVVGVDPAYQRHGVLDQMRQAVEADVASLASGRGEPDISLWVEFANWDIAGAFEEKGYSPNGSSCGYRVMRKDVPAAQLDRPSYAD